MTEQPECPSCGAYGVYQQANIRQQGSMAVTADGDRDFNGESGFHIDGHPVVVCEDCGELIPLEARGVTQVDIEQVLINFKRIENSKGEDDPADNLRLRNAIEKILAHEGYIPDGWDEKSDREAFWNETALADIYVTLVEIAEKYQIDVDWGLDAVKTTESNKVIE